MLSLQRRRKKKKPQGSLKSGSSRGHPSVRPGVTGVNLPSLPFDINDQKPQMPQLGFQNIWKRQLPPSLEDSPYQKVFVASLEEFEASLIKVWSITMVAALVGIVARVVCHSSSAMHLTILSICLSLNWFCGFVASYRTRKDLANVHFRNLNGSNNFEALMIFS